MNAAATSTGESDATGASDGTANKPGAGSPLSLLLPLCWLPGALGRSVQQHGAENEWEAGFGREGGEARSTHYARYVHTAPDSNIGHCFPDSPVRPSTRS